MNVGSRDVRPISDEECATADARRLALDCMLAALEHLDSDAEISPVVGSQLQLAIDRLVSSMGRNNARSR
jgi:hypothetical protein